MDETTRTPLLFSPPPLPPSSPAPKEHPIVDPFSFSADDEKQKQQQQQQQQQQQEEKRQHDEQQQQQDQQPTMQQQQKPFASLQAALTQMQVSNKRRIVVQHRTINMGADIKFEEDAMKVQLNGIMTALEYVNAITNINEALHACRATTLDHALLLMGPTMLPLIPWAIRNKQHKNERRQIMRQCVENFNTSFPLLYMKWDTKPEKELSIWRGVDAEAEMNK